MNQYKYAPFVSPTRWGDKDYWNRIAYENMGIQTASKVVAIDTKWLIPFFLPIGKFTLLAGEPNSGKSTLAMAIAALVTNGERQTAWPCEVTYGYGHVLISSKEENFADTIRPRAEAAGVNLDRLHAISKIRPNVQFDWDGINLMLPDHVQKLSDGLSSLGDGFGIGLFILDPASQIIAGDIGNNSAIQDAYTQLGCQSASKSFHLSAFKSFHFFSLI